MTLAHWLDRAAAGFPDWPAVAHGTKVHQTYGQLAERAARLAAGLNRLGIMQGDRVAIAAKNGPAYLEILFAGWWANLALVPINAKLHGAEIGDSLEQSGAKACFATGDIANGIDAHRPDTLAHLIEIGTPDYEALFSAEPAPRRSTGPDDLAWLFFTSGTTGRPKGAMLSHRNLMAMSWAYLADVDPTPMGSPILHSAPMSHGSGMYIKPHVLRLGVNVVPESGGFDPLEIAHLFNHWRDASMFAAPTMIKRLVDADVAIDPGAIRTIVWGGAPMYVEDARRAIDRFGPCLAQIYGQGETPMTTTVLTKEMIANRDHPRWEARLGSAGMVSSAVEVRIADAEDTTLPVGEQGEVLVRGESVMLGYWNNANATETTLRGGWLHTGDIGSFDEDGFLTLHDRSKDMIISGGSNIYPREVEEVLLTDPRVREVSVIGRPDPDWGEVVIAYVVGDAPEADLDRLCLDRIARFKRPKAYVRIDALPKNNYGKILKTELRARDTERVAGHQITQREDRS